MSYEGRIIYLCENGHMSIQDAYEDLYGELNSKCRYCDTSLRRIGGVDDTNGDSVSSFYLKEIIPEESTVIKSGYGKDVIFQTTFKPPTYEVVRGKKNEYFNFDTGEKLTNYL